MCVYMTLDHSLEAGACYLFYPRLCHHPGWHGWPHDGLLLNLLTYLFWGLFLSFLSTLKLSWLCPCLASFLPWGQRSAINTTALPDPQSSSSPWEALMNVEWINAYIPPLNAHWESVMVPILAISILYQFPYLSPKPDNELMRLRPVLA